MPAPRKMASSRSIFDVHQNSHDSTALRDEEAAQARKITGRVKNGGASSTGTNWKNSL